MARGGAGARGHTRGRAKVPPFSSRFASHSSQPLLLLGGCRFPSGSLLDQLSASLDLRALAPWHVPQGAALGPLTTEGGQDDRLPNWGAPTLKSTLPAPWAAPHQARRASVQNM